MAEFDQAIVHVIQAEGGYRVVRVEGDRGGQTCAGISRRANPKWAGWELVDQGIPADDPEVVERIHERYRNAYWNPVGAEHIDDQDLATAVFSCAVLSGPKTAVRLLQMAVGSDQDGIIGPRTLAGVNAAHNGLTIAGFTLARIARYVAICNNDRSQSKFLLGWINRALGEAD